MNKINSQAEYYICHFKHCDTKIADSYSTCFTNILRTELRTKMIPGCNLQAIITESTTQLELKTQTVVRRHHTIRYF